MKQPLVITKGLKYKSHSFSASAQVFAIRKESNEVDILYTDSQGLQWVAAKCDLHALVDGFKKGTHYIPEPDKVNISIQ